MYLYYILTCCKDTNYNLISHIYRLLLRLHDIIYLYYNQLSCLISHIRCTKKVWKPKMIN